MASTQQRRENNCAKDCDFPNGRKTARVLRGPGTKGVNHKSIELGISVVRLNRHPSNQIGILLSFLSPRLLKSILVCLMRYGHIYDHGVFCCLVHHYQVRLHRVRRDGLLYENVFLFWSYCPDEAMQDYVMPCSHEPSIRGTGIQNVA